MIPIKLTVKGLCEFMYQVPLETHVPGGVEFVTKVGVISLVGSDAELLSAVGVMRRDAVIIFAPEGMFNVELKYV